MKELNNGYNRKKHDRNLKRPTWEGKSVRKES